MVCQVSETERAAPATDAQIEKKDASHKRATRTNKGLRDGTGRVRREWQHRKIMGAKRGEIVHHIDLNPGNNNIGNLHVFTSPAEHALAHRSLERSAAELLCRGLIEFDRVSGLYQLVEFAYQSNA